MKRTLSLKRESLTLLTNDEMAALATAASLPTWATFEVNSLDPLTGCVAAIRESIVCPASGSGCHTWDSDCSCRI